MRVHWRSNELARPRMNVASSEYTAESRMIRDGLRVLTGRDRAVERSLRGQIGRLLAECGGTFGRIGATKRRWPRESYIDNAVSLIMRACAP
jgi:hypothetical protein